jgi:hypothetical protein
MFSYIVYIKKLNDLTLKDRHKDTKKFEDGNGNPL